MFPAEYLNQGTAPESSRQNRQTRRDERRARFAAVRFRHPFLPIEVPRILADYVALDQGSGMVRTASGQGANDAAKRSLKSKDWSRLFHEIASSIALAVAHTGNCGARSSHESVVRDADGRELAA